MQWNRMSRASQLRALSTAVLVIGLLGALVIDWRASQPAANPLGDPEDSKVYLRQMEMYGGKSNLMANDVRQWLGSLWHGKRLAFTVGVLAVVVAAGLRFVADTEEESDGPPAKGTGAA